MLVHVWKTYAEPLGLDVYVYENGYAIEGEAKLPLEDIINDKSRQEYYDLYIGALCNAVKDHGVKMAGYHCWSLLEYVALVNALIGVWLIDCSATSNGTLDIVHDLV